MIKSNVSNRRVKSIRTLQAAIAAVSLLSVPGLVSATTYYMDLNGATAGFGTATGTINWDDAVWSTSSAGTAATVTYAAALTAAGTNNVFPTFSFTGTPTYTINATGDEKNVGMSFATVQNVNITTSGSGTIDILQGTGGGTNQHLQGFFNQAGGVVTISGVISGAGGPEFETGGTWALTNTAGTNTFLGLESIGAGVVVNIAANALSAPANQYNVIQASTSGKININGDAYVSALLGGTTTAPITLNNNAILTIATIPGISTTYNASATLLSGNGGITVIGTGSGTGVQILTGFDSAAGDGYRFTGPVTIGPKGILKIDDLHNAGVGSSLGASTAANPASNLVFNGGTLWSIAPTQNAGVSTDRNYTLAASSTIQSDGQNSSSGAITFSGNMTATNTTPAIMTLNGSSNSNQINILGGTIPDSATSTVGITKSGSNTWQLGISGNTGNTYSGPTTLSAGTLVLGSTNAIGSNSSVTVNSGTILNMNGQSTGVGALHLIGGAITNGATSTITSATTYDVQNGAITAGLAGTSGAVGLNKTTSATVTITGDQTYTGNTTVSAGTLFLNGGNTQSSGTIDVLSAAKLGGTSNFNGPVTIENGAHFVAGTAHGNATSSVGSSGTMDFKDGANLDFTLGAGTSDTLDAFSNGAAPNALTFEGAAPGSITINLSPTQSGTFPIIFYNGSYGVPAIDAGNPVSVFQLGSIGAASSASLSDDGFFSISATVAVATRNWNVDADGDWAVGTNWDTGTQPNGQGASATFGNVITGPHTVTISDTNKTVGLLTFDNTTPGARYTIAATGGFKLVMDSTGGAVIQDNNGSHSITAPVVLNADTTLNVANAADSVTMSGAISGAGAFTKAGNGSALISGAMTNAGALANTGSGTVTFSGAVALAQVNGSGITNTGSGTMRLTGVISGSNSFSNLIVNSGIGTISIGGTANTYTGKVIINSGTVFLAGDGSLGSGTGGATDTIYIHNGAKLQLGSGASLTSGRGITIDKGGTETIEVPTGTATWAGYITVGGSASGNTTIVKSGPGLLNVNTGVPALVPWNKLIVSGGTYQWASTASLPGVAATDEVTLTGGGTFLINEAATFAVNGIGITLGAGGGGFGSAGTNVNSWSDIIAGSGPLTLPGTGTITFAGINTFTGGVIQQAGTTAVATGASLMAPGGNLTINGGSLGMSNAAQAVGNLTGTGGALVLLGSHTMTVTPTADGTLGTALLGSGSIVYNGTTFTETLTAGDTLGGGITINSGTVAVNGTADSSLGNISGAGTLSKANTGTLTVNYVRTAGLTVSGGTVKVAANGTSSGTSVVTALSISGGALDLNNNKLVVTNGTLGAWNGTAYSGVTGMIQTGRAGGTWAGSGIITSQSSAKVGGQFLTTLAVDSASDAGYGGTTTFGGQTVNPGDTLVMYTYTGDMNLDGKINGDDYFKIDQGYMGSLTGYANGDLNLDGRIDADDYFLIDSNYGNQTLGVFPTNGAPLDMAAASLPGVSAVPEPASLALLGLATAGLFGRRRRNK